MEYKLISSPNEIDLFVNAWEAAFSRVFNEKLKSWIFNQRNNMYVVTEENKIIAGYCLLNNKVIYKGEILDGALCNNVFVHPDYQGLNLFIKLGRYALQDAAKQGKEIILGIPNRNAVPGHRRVGWTLFDSINFLEIDKIKYSNPSKSDNVKSINIENYNNYEVILEQFAKDVSSKRSFSVLKDRNYFKWRYLERPLVNYKIYAYIKDNLVEGYVVYKYYKEMKKLHIVDIEARNYDVFVELLNQTSFINEQIDLINVWGSSIYLDYFMDAGFRVSNESNNLIAIMPNNSGKVDLGQNINIVLGDNEVF